MTSQYGSLPIIIMDYRFKRLLVATFVALLLGENDKEKKSLILK
jgi:hypothetical protein